VTPPCYQRILIKLSVAQYLGQQKSHSGQPVELKDFIRWRLGET
jgi:hypothetical protein